MGTIAELSVPTTEFALCETLAAVPDAELEVERVAAHGERALVPFVWVRTSEFERFEAALGDDSSVGEFECVSTLETERLYRMDWVGSTRLLVHAVLEADSTVLSATGSDDHWQLRLLFPDHDALSTVHDHCRAADIEFEITSIYELEGQRHRRYGLTARQHRTLIEGVERGYYEIPRELTLGEFAERLDVSHQALSERLRRGHRNLIESGLIAGREPSGFEEIDRDGS
ncbi:helix-turn-helix domain-containing protein [Halalkalicoccus subterraneus]|uniref:helix-turn-helix domain-containing protein n=1 Tax=Halalkalicoccus subterraneus TaxID=2675002 RepID=UPI000EFBEDBA|nr:bacterio-opsin activator domain-containing protein [Halalkalicoccus subterraneus]